MAPTTVDYNRTSDAVSGKYVLLVDDDPETLEVLCQVLRRDGFLCLPAEDGTEALQLFRQHEIGVGLIDFDLPDVNGVELIRTLKRERPEVPLLLMTGNPSQRILFDACDARAYAFLRKPLDLQRMRALLRKAMQQQEDVQVTMSGIEMKPTSVFVRWSRWIVRKK